ncbi:MAG: DUF952 domain-containing protein [Hyphomicrobium sp.]
MSTDVKVYKILPRASWDTAVAGGAFAGSADDVRDGFIHLSAAHQIASTLERHFKGTSDLVLVAFDAAELGNALKWEASRGGALFPHLYAPLPTALARGVWQIATGSNGVAKIEEAWLA